MTCRHTEDGQHEFAGGRCRFDGAEEPETAEQHYAGFPLETYLEVLHEGVPFLRGWFTHPGFFVGSYLDGKPARTGLAEVVPGRSFRRVAGLTPEEVSLGR